MSNLETVMRPVYRDSYNFLMRYNERLSTIRNDDEFWCLASSDFEDMCRNHGMHPAAITQFTAAYEVLEAFWKEHKHGNR